MRKNLGGVSLGDAQQSEDLLPRFFSAEDIHHMLKHRPLDGRVHSLVEVSSITG
jgi:hypothetical protein